MMRTRRIRVHPKWRLFRPGSGRAAGPPAYAYVALYALCLALGHWSSTQYGAIVIWPANGVLLAALLQLHRRSAIQVLAAGFALNLAGNVLRGDPFPFLALAATLNLVEVMAVGMLARRLCGAALDLRRPVRLARFVFLAVAPVVSLMATIGIAIALATLDVTRTPYEIWVSFRTWFTVDALGLILVAPALVLLARGRLFADAGERSPLEVAALVGGTVAITALVFAQAKAPVLFLIFPPLLLVAFRLAPAWSALTVLLIALIAGGATFSGHGPITLSTLGPQAWRNPDMLPLLRTLPVYHLFIAAILSFSLPASTVLTERRRLEGRLKARTASAMSARADAERVGRRASHLAHHDPDTDLLNRAGLERALTQMIGRNSGRQVFMGALGIDRFPAIRTAIGAGQASLLLAQAARRLDARVSGAQVGRLSSTSIGIALPARNLEEAAAKLDEAREALAEPLEIGASLIDVRLTIGLAGYPDHAATGPVLVERAQIALDQARDAHAPFAAFDAAAERAAAGGLTLLSELRAGLDTGEVWLAHQPKLDLRAGTVDGVECLIRWTHPERGALAPDDFMPLVEETGFIDPLTDWILARAVDEQKTLGANGVDLDVAVNISGRSLCEAGFAERLIAIAAARGAPARRITLEITETAIMTRPDAAFANLGKLRAAGFGLAIDDYGTGLSSLAYLRRIPADTLKLDRSFVHRLAKDAKDAVLVRSTIELAHSLGLKVIAEGVEDQETLDLLGLFGCDFAQGYFIGAPVPAARLLDGIPVPQGLPAKPPRTPRLRAAS